jgi:cytochrome c peroxidase
MAGNSSRRYRFRSIQSLSFVLGTILLLALAVPGSPPSGPRTTARPSHGGESPPADQGPRGSLKYLVPSRSTLESFAYPQWQQRYLENGGDRNVLVGLRWTMGMSNEPSEARGTVKLDLIGGSVIAHVQGLGDQPADLWLVDNSDEPGMTSLPEPGDRMHRVGRLETSGRGARLSADLGPKFFPAFELDTLVVSRAEATPAESRILLGTRLFFDRVYTKTRLEVERSRPRGFRALLTSLLSPRDAHADSTQILIAHGLVKKAVGDGADLFFRGTFNGNGRTCGTCHRVENNLGIDAAFIATLPPSDPIFVAERPASQGGVPGLERPLLMRGHGLILENVDGAENPTVKFVMRGVPHTLSVLTTVRAPGVPPGPPSDGRRPVERPGWSGDGAPDDVDPTKAGALRLFPNGAIFQHFTKSLNRVRNVDFRLATDPELDAMEAYMEATGRLNDLVDLKNSVTMFDAGAERGRRIFNNNPSDPNNTDPDPTIGAGKCFLCHLNAGANRGANFPDGSNNNFDTGVERRLHLARSTENFPFDGGFGGAPSPNRDCDFDGVLDCFGDATFNAAPLIESADTPPFFHNNVVTTVEGAVEFYSGEEFRASGSGGLNINLRQDQSADVAAFLRVINASFNADMAIQRNDAAISLENSAPTGCGGGGGGDPSSPAVSSSTDASCAESSGDETGKRATVDRLLELSNEEAQDAIDVLSPRNLHQDAVTLLQSAIDKNNQAIASGQSQVRKDLMISARSDLSAARQKFGIGLSLTMGEGNLLF